MSLRPVDMQTILPKIQSINSARETVVHKQDNELLQGQMAISKQAEQNKKKVLLAEQKEDQKIKDDRDSSEGSNGKKHKKKNDKDSDDTKKKEQKLQSLDYHTFDMKV